MEKSLAGEGDAESRVVVLIPISQLPQDGARSTGASRPRGRVVTASLERLLNQPLL